ncbi:glutamate-ammonia-ligase adenylyltransferase [Poseidonocella pacifica]|uniref:Glutamate-ammonia-ligase adenylyltransferase n=1 Tax=Poseidonocella pacifica TaxID=871651 RepID=A0A1I0VU03_9RHOB|nr:glutamine-synthetase adenylyltransferase [Poseidonocella pacifica]SFA79156.1 glutamate-ammonia-ligase adenylyltransferase [Poseidonocella pacifica]
MSFASRLTRTPHPYEPDHAAEIAPLVDGLSPELAELIRGTAGSSPYLKGLIEKEADWWPAALDDPEAALEGVLRDVRALDADAMQRDLRRAKRRVALLVGLADLGGVWALEEVTGGLTRFADAATHAALLTCVGAEIRRGRIPGVEEAEGETGGLVTLAMGKMGAGELNYSSDIDLICLFDESRYAPEDFAEARQALVRATRKLCAMLSDNTADGYVFRTDLRLRPDPSVTPVVLSMEGAMRYYESLGRTWERAAYIKARPCAGDLDAGERFLKELTPFVWRRHLDFAAIRDAHDMRLRIRDHKGHHGAITLEKHDMKLGRGGIREIEFFTQTQQIIAGGRDPELRVRGTVEGLRRLAAKGWVPQDVADRLILRYRQHREVEHRIQMIGDVQTHDLPRTDAGFDRLAALMGQDQATLRREIKDGLEEVQSLIEGFFAPDRGQTCEPETPAIPDEVASRWLSYPALRSARAQEIFGRLRPEIETLLGDADRPEEALLAFDGFLRGLPAGVQLFSLFEANPQLINLLIDICAISPALGAHLSRNAAVFDAVIDGDFFSDWPGVPALVRALEQRLAGEDDYERKLDAARRWQREWHFRIGVHHLRGLISAEEAGRDYAQLAEAVIKALWPAVVAHFAHRHGGPPGRGAVVLGMGSLGAGRTNARSDLDLIVIYDADGEAMSDGRRPLSARPYFARLTQALVTALSAPMAGGRLYEVDMRLRPSGSQGPVATSFASFQRYQREDAWTWEHLALTRARPLAGEEDLAADIEAVRAEVLSAPRDRAALLKDVSDMRARIAAAKSPDGPLDPKIGAGRLQDIEIFSQAATVLAGRSDRKTVRGLVHARRLGLVSRAEALTLKNSHDLCVLLLVSTRLIAETTPKPETMGLGARRFLLDHAREETLEDFIARLVDLSNRAAGIIDRALDGTDDDNG